MTDSNTVTSKSVKGGKVEDKTEEKKVAKAAPKKAAPKKASPKNKTSGDEILLKMTQGRSYSIYEHDFTLDHPFKLIPKELALNLLATGSFERAKDSEVKAFYG